MPESELCCLKRKWSSEKKQTDKLLKLLLAQIKTTPSATRTEKLTTGADTEVLDEDTQGDSSGNSSDETEQLEKKAVPPTIKTERCRGRGGNPRSSVRTTAGRGLS